MSSENINMVGLSAYQLQILDDLICHGPSTIKEILDRISTRPTINRISVSGVLLKLSWLEYVKYKKGGWYEATVTLNRIVDQQVMAAWR